MWAHGLMSSIATENAHDWFQWERLNQVVRLIRYDARGHGRSSAQGDAGAFRWDSLAADLLAVADAAGAQTFVAGGMSMGCATALHAAIQAPGRIAGLVLAMPPTVWETRAAQRTLYQRIASHGHSPGGRALARLMSRDMARNLPAWLADAQHGLSASLAIGANALDPAIVPALFQAAGESDLPPRDAFAALAHVPALILGWNGDAIHPLSSAQELHRLLPDSDLYIANSHADFATFPARIRAFLAGL
ncbi:MAG: alpha/beta fold hydrolase [Telluria sp.]